MLACFAAFGVDTFTSSFFLTYVHCVFPLYHTMVLGVEAWNIFFFIDIVPLCLILSPVIVKFAVVPLLMLNFAAALSSVFLAADDESLAAVEVMTAIAIRTMIVRIFFIVIVFIYITHPFWEGLIPLFQFNVFFYIIILLSMMRYDCQEPARL